MKTLSRITLALSLLLFAGCQGLSLKPVPVAEGHDPVVVNAERALTSSLRIYKIVTDWEMNNRAALPAEVSRAIDAVRQQFPGAWKEADRAIDLYKAQVPGADASTIDRISGSLLVFQDTLLRLKSNAKPGDVAQLNSSLATIISSLKVLFSSPTPQPQP